MKKKFKLENLDCAQCAAKMEAGIRKLAGVNDVSISFISGKMTLDADDAVFENVLENAKKVCAGIEPDCRII